MTSVSKIENNKNKEEQIYSKERVIEIFKEEIKEVDKDLESDNISDEERIELNNMKKRNIASIQYYEKIIQDIKDENWQVLYEDELKLSLDSNGNLAIKGFSTNGIDYAANKLTAEITYKILKYLKENNIPSAHPLYLDKTEFEQPRTLEESKLLDYYSKKTLIGTSHRLWDFFTNNLVLIYTFIIVVTFGILFSKLEESQNKTIRFLRASGASKFIILSFGLIATLQMFNKWYNPFSYWRVGKIADGSINILSKTITYSFNKSCKILVIGICILTILLICIAFIQDRRRKYA